jgi:hypothetical protein
MFWNLLPGRRASARESLAVLEGLETRRLMSCVILVKGDAMLILGSDDAETVVITDDGAGNVAAVCDGKTAVGKGIRRVGVLTFGGNDSVTYNITGDLTTPRDIGVDLGTGNDSFSFDLQGDVLAPAKARSSQRGREQDDHDEDGDGKGGGTGGRLNLLVSGSGGDDQVAANLKGDITPGAQVNLVINVGAGNDTVDVMFAGMQDGVLRVDVRGDKGNDTIRTGLALVFISTGTTIAEVRGEDGNDSLHLQIIPPQPTAGVRGLIDGGPGFDMCTHTANVETKNCEV